MLDEPGSLFEEEEPQEPSFTWTHEDADVRPVLPPHTRVRVLRRLLALACLGAGALLVVVGLLLASDRQPQALGVLVGALTGALVSGSWVLGALLSFDGPLRRFQRLTVGLWPLRFAVLFLGIALGTKVLHADLNALVLSLLAAWVGGQILHGLVTMALADAAKAAPPQPPPPSQNG